MKVRTIKLIKKLLSSSYPININVLSNYFNVSPRTIQNLILEANEYLMDLNLKEIKNIRGKVFLLESSLEEKEQIVMSIFQDGFFYLEKEERELDLLLSIAFSDNPIFLNKKESEYLVSKSTIDEDMRRLRKKLSKYDIEITSNGKFGYLLVGSERSIRTMLFDVINREIGPIE
ncbi:helix-turn-helix domain-containing protein [Vagococcus fluvialis]|uniref:helix-turn-helix domain-containing protein n=1 Tax=Vagococcus fluvialis TaxID=2738 RepID=UPI003B5C7FDE